MPVLSCNARSLPLEAFSGSFRTLRNSSRMFTCHEGIDISFYMTVQSKTLLSMLSTTLQSVANGQVNASVQRCWPFPPALATSEIHQNRFEEQIFSPASPAGAELYRNRIERLLFSPISPVGATFDQNRIEEALFSQTSTASALSQVNQVEEPQSAPSLPGKSRMTPRNRSSHIPQPFPRYFEELHPERWYLLDCLQIENRKATELLLSIALLEERLAENNKSFFRPGKIKKRLGWLRGRLNEANRQERGILTRLGQVTLEIQTRERWTQIENERRMYEYELYQQYYHGFQGRQQTPLNPASPEFQPRGYHVCREPRPPVSCQQWEFYDGQEGSEGTYEPAAEKASSYPSDLAAQRSPSQEDAPDGLETIPYPSLHREIRSVSLIHRSSSLNIAAEQLGVLSTNTATTLVPKVKRLSLPSLPIS